MTRRGTMAYYLAAWVCGCFFMSLLIWVKDVALPGVGFVSMRSAFGLLFVYFYSLILGAASALLGGFLLRRIAALARWKTPAQWALCGAILAPILLGMLGSLGRLALAGPKPAPGWVSLILYGPKTVLEAGWWLSIPAGAATALVLGKIQCAFATQSEAPPQRPSAQ